MVYVVSVAGGQPAEIGYGRSPVWSPDGNGLLYLRARGGPLEPEWAFTNLDGEEPAFTGAMEVLRESGLDGDPKILWGPVFVPQRWLDDGRVLFSGRAGQAFNIWAISVTRGNGRVSGLPQRITTGSGEHRFAGAVEDGRISFSDVRENYDIWILPADTNLGKATGEIQRATSNTAADHYPSLSADGTKLAFWSNRSGRGGIWLKDLITQALKPLTSTDVREGASLFTKADGEFVAYATFGAAAVAGPSYDTYSIRTTDGIRQKLCEDCGFMSDWSPSGKLLVGFGSSTASRVPDSVDDLGTTLTDLKSRRSRVLFRTNWANARFSPNEKWLAFHRNAKNFIRQVFIAPIPAEGEVDESQLIPITDGSHNSFRPDWSSDGKLIFYGSDRDGYSCIYSQPLDPDTKRPSGPVREVYHSHDARLSMAAIRNPAYLGLSVAQDKIAFTMAEITGDIWIMEPRDAE